MTLATFSGKLKVFDCNDNYSLKGGIVLSDEKIFGRISSTTNGEWFAVTPSSYGDGRLPIVRHKDSELKTKKYVTIRNVISAAFLNNSNRYIFVGDKSGSIFTWDIKKQKLVAQIARRDKKPPDFICTDCEDSSLATATLHSGFVYLHSLSKHNSVTKIADCSHVTCLRFCKCKQTLLAASNTEGIISVWDVAKSKCVFQHTSEQPSACTDISFSPVNYSIMMSVGLTKMMKIFDLRVRKPILIVNVGESMNCADLDINGESAAFGTVNGRILVYNLRLNKIVHNFQAYDRPVFSVKMQGKNSYPGEDNIVELKEKYPEVNIRQKSSEGHGLPFSKKVHECVRSKIDSRSLSTESDISASLEMNHGSLNPSSDEYAMEQKLLNLEETQSVYSEISLQEIKKELLVIRREQKEVSNTLIQQINSVKQSNEEKCKCLRDSLVLLRELLTGMSRYVKTDKRPHSLKRYKHCRCNKQYPGTENRESSYK